MRGIGVIAAFLILLSPGRAETSHSLSPQTQLDGKIAPSAAVLSGILDRMDPEDTEDANTETSLLNMFRSLMAPHHPELLSRNPPDWAKELRDIEPPFAKNHWAQHSAALESLASSLVGNDSLPALRQVSSRLGNLYYARKELRHDTPHPDHRLYDSYARKACFFYGLSHFLAPGHEASHLDWILSLKHSRSKRRSRFGESPSEEKARKELDQLLQRKNLERKTVLKARTELAYLHWDSLLPILRNPNPQLSTLDFLSLHSKIDSILSLTDDSDVIPRALSLRGSALVSRAWFTYLEWLERRSQKNRRPQNDPSGQADPTDQSEWPLQLGALFPRLILDLREGLDKAQQAIQDSTQPGQKRHARSMTEDTVSFSNLLLASLSQEAFSGSCIYAKGDFQRLQKTLLEISEITASVPEGRFFNPAELLSWLELQKRMQSSVLEEIRAFSEEGQIQDENRNEVLAANILKKRFPEKEAQGPIPQAAVERMLPVLVRTLSQQWKITPQVLALVCVHNTFSGESLSPNEFKGLCADLLGTAVNDSHFPAAFEQAAKDVVRHLQLPIPWKAAKEKPDDPLPSQTPVKSDGLRTPEEVYRILDSIRAGLEKLPQVLASPQNGSGNAEEYFWQTLERWGRRTTHLGVEMEDIRTRLESIHAETDLHAADKNSDRGRKRWKGMEKGTSITQDALSLKARFETLGKFTRNALTSIENGLLTEVSRIEGEKRQLSSLKQLFPEAWARWDGLRDELKFVVSPESSHYLDWEFWEQKMEELRQQTLVLQDWNRHLGSYDSLFKTISSCRSLLRQISALLGNGSEWLEDALDELEQTRETILDEWALQKRPVDEYPALESGRIQTLETRLTSLRSWLGNSSLLIPAQSPHGVAFSKTEMARIENRLQSEWSAKITALGSPGSWSRAPEELLQNEAPLLAEALSYRETLARYERGATWLARGHSLPPEASLPDRIAVAQAALDDFLKTFSEDTSPERLEHLQNQGTFLKDSMRDLGHTFHALWNSILSEEMKVYARFLERWNNQCAKKFPPAYYTEVEAQIRKAVNFFASAVPSPDGNSGTPFDPASVARAYDDRLKTAKAELAAPITQSFLSPDALTPAFQKMGWLPPLSESSVETYQSLLGLVWNEQGGVEGLHLDLFPQAAKLEEHRFDLEIRFSDWVLKTGPSGEKKEALRRAIQNAATDSDRQLLQEAWDTLNSYAFLLHPVSDTLWVERLTPYLLLGTLRVLNLSVAEILSDWIRAPLSCFEPEYAMPISALSLDQLFLHAYHAFIPSSRSSEDTKLDQRIDQSSLHIYSKRELMEIYFKLKNTPQADWSKVLKEEKSKNPNSTLEALHTRISFNLGIQLGMQLSANIESVVRGGIALLTPGQVPQGSTALLNFLALEITTRSFQEYRQLLMGIWDQPKQVLFFLNDLFFDLSRVGNKTYPGLSDLGPRKTALNLQRYRRNSDFTLFQLSA